MQVFLIIVAIIAVGAALLKTKPAAKIDGGNGQSTSLTPPVGDTASVIGTGDVELPPGVVPVSEAEIPTLAPGENEVSGIISEEEVMSKINPATRDTYILFQPKNIIPSPAVLFVQYTHLNSRTCQDIADGMPAVENTLAGYGVTEAQVKTIRKLLGLVMYAAVADAIAPITRQVYPRGNTLSLEVNGRFAYLRPDGGIYAELTGGKELDAYLLMTNSQLEDNIRRLNDRIKDVKASREKAVRAYEALIDEAKTNPDISSADIEAARREKNSAAFSNEVKAVEAEIKGLEKLLKGDVGGVPVTRGYSIKLQKSSGKFAIVDLFNPGIGWTRSGLTRDYVQTVLNSLNNGEIAKAEAVERLK